MNGNVKLSEYFYDGENKRVKKHVYNADGVTLKEVTVFVYSSGKLIAEYSTKTPINPTISYMATDQLDSPRVITNAFGEVISRRDFMPFGEELYNVSGERSSGMKYGETDSVRQKFTSYHRDEETLLDFAEARMYENRHARFTAVDPLLASGKSANPQTFNRYVYVINNPLKYTDPDGLQLATNPNEIIAVIHTIWNRVTGDYEQARSERTRYLLTGEYPEESYNPMAERLTFRNPIINGNRNSSSETTSNGMNLTPSNSEGSGPRILLGDTRRLSASDKQRINENPIDFVRNGRISERGNTLRSPDYITLDVSFMTTGTSFTADAYGNNYYSPLNFNPRSPIDLKTFGEAKPTFANGLKMVKFGVSLNAGWLNQYPTPTEEQTRNLLTGNSIGFNIGTTKGLGGGLVRSPGNGTATQLGVSTPGPTLTFSDNFPLRRRNFFIWRGEGGNQ